MRYYIIVGEASGDLHGSNLMKGILAKDPQAEFRFWGGDLMSSISGVQVRHYKGTSVMGIVEVVSKLGKIFKNMKFCKEDILKYSPDVVILIDYPGFNLKIAKFAKENGLKVFYYIAPKVWASREGRIAKLKKYVDKLFIIFPFEIEYFKRKGLDAIYCGNPLIDSVDNDPAMSESREEFLRRNGISGDLETIALLAGSRRMEIDQLMPVYAELAKRYKGKYQFLLAAAPSIPLSYYDKYIDGVDIKPIQSDTYAIVRHSKAAVVASGTASLEAALIGTPQVVCYRVNVFTAMLAKMLLKIKYVSLGNLIIDSMAFKELLQKDCTVEKISAELGLLTKDEVYIEKMKGEYAKIREMLGGSGASEKIAETMLETIRNSYK